MDASPHVWVFDSLSGRLSLDGAFVCFAYSGHGAGRDNPQLETVADVGPIPEGSYSISLEPAGSHANLGDPVLRFTPLPGTEMHGRSGFLGHGDNAKHDASLGCIVFPYGPRCTMALTLGTLRVVPGTDSEVSV